RLDWHLAARKRPHLLGRGAKSKACEHEFHWIAERNAKNKVARSPEPSNGDALFVLADLSKRQPDLGAEGPSTISRNLHHDLRILTLTHWKTYASFHIGDQFIHCHA